MKKEYITKRLSIRFLLKLLVMIFVIITILFYFFINFVVINPTLEVGRQEAKNIMVSCEEVIKSRFNRIMNIATTITYDDDFIEYMMTDDLNDIFEKQDDILSFIADCCKIGDDVICIEAVDKLGKYRHLYGLSIFNINLNNQPNIEECGDNEYMFIKDGSTDKVSYCCYRRNIAMLNNIGDYKKDLGTLYVIFKTDEIQKTFNKLNLSNEGFIALISADNVVQISSIDNVGEILYDQGETITPKSVLGNLRLVIDDNIDSVYVNNIVFLSKLIIAVFVILCIFIMGLYLLFVKKFIIPVKQISDEMCDNHTYKGRINVVCHDELDIIVKSANNMLDSLEMQSRKIMENQRKLYEMEIQNQKSMISSMQSQINPHFLYNTLECMRSIALVHNCSQISMMCVSLAKIFRYSIANEFYVTFSEEIEIVKQYMKIMNARFSGKIEVIYDIDESVLDKKCPKMIIQPIIENAVQHGIEKIISKGILKISICEQEGSIYINIKDNGCGIEEEKLQEIIDQCQRGIESKKHIGIYNVHKRLELIYGKTYGLDIKSKLGEGTEVVMKIPVILQSESKENKKTEF